MSEKMAVIRQLVSAYPQVEVSRETIAVYVRELADVPAGELEMVVRAHIRESRFFPTVAELRERHDALWPERKWKRLGLGGLARALPPPDLPQVGGGTVVGDDGEKGE